MQPSHHKLSTLLLDPEIDPHRLCQEMQELLTRPPGREIRADHAHKILFWMLRAVRDGYIEPATYVPLAHSLMHVQIVAQNKSDDQAVSLLIHRTLTGIVCKDPTAVPLDTIFAVVGFLHCHVDAAPVVALDVYDSIARIVAVVAGRSLLAALVLIAELIDGTEVEHPTSSAVRRALHIPSLGITSAQRTWEDTTVTADILVSIFSTVKEPVSADVARFLADVILPCLSTLTYSPDAEIVASGLRAVEAVLNVPYNGPELSKATLAVALVIHAAPLATLLFTPPQAFASPAPLTPTAAETTGPIGRAQLGLAQAHTACLWQCSQRGRHTQLKLRLLHLARFIESRQFESCLVHSFSIAGAVGLSQLIATIALASPDDHKTRLLKALSTVPEASRVPATVDDFASAVALLDTRLASLAVSLAREKHTPAKFTELCRQYGIEAGAQLLFHAAYDAEALGELLGSPVAGQASELSRQFYRLHLSRCTPVDDETDLRMFAKAFILPGEGQVIERVLTAFAEERQELLNNGAAFPVQFYDDDKDGMTQADSAAQLLMMLLAANTNAHNPHAKDKFGLTQFKSMMSATNGGHGYPEGYIDTVYSGIAAHPIRHSASLLALLTSSLQAPPYGQQNPDRGNPATVFTDTMAQAATAALAWPADSTLHATPLERQHARAACFLLITQTLSRSLLQDYRASPSTATLHSLVDVGNTAAALGGARHLNSVVIGLHQVAPALRCAAVQSGVPITAPELEAILSLAADHTDMLDAAWPNIVEIMCVLGSVSEAPLLPEENALIPLVPDTPVEADLTIPAVPVGRLLKALPVHRARVLTAVATGLWECTTAVSRQPAARLVTAHLHLALAALSPAVGRSSHIFSNDNRGWSAVDTIVRAVMRAKSARLNVYGLRLFLIALSTGMAELRAVDGDTTAAEQSAVLVSDVAQIIVHKAVLADAPRQVLLDVLSVIVQVHETTPLAVWKAVDPVIMAALARSPEEVLPELIDLYVDGKVAPKGEISLCAVGTMASAVCAGLVVESYSHLFLQRPSFALLTGLLTPCARMVLDANKSSECMGLLLVSMRLLKQALYSDSSRDVADAASSLSEVVGLLSRVKMTEELEGNLEGLKAFVPSIGLDWPE
ncbi:Sec7 domain [Carpediemonas membranifera]|uniref:Sec7 domain n=1 Tax=Carpediemonas membranifera TaxID=201153 RepID=A0A8J6B6K2_9EUKA|nr:Sec7 domain [Carpediemonas membranifera]|eukprot:KAG9391047.1 Sec7 domain [Carpediemonas membranifera]